MVSKTTRSFVALLIGMTLIYSAMHPKTLSRSSDGEGKEKHPSPFTWS
jgi:hypothetical protein